MTKSFDMLYRAFEDKFRGSPDLIRERLRIYLPLLEQVPADNGRQRRAIDLGCGRGEWLEVVSEAGFEPLGVDLNTGMAQAALDKGFVVEIGDAIEFMQRQEASSASIVSAFHLAEHLPMEKLLDLLSECHRVLEDGGILILETPNPENISVGTWTFYLDPTHQKPLPPILLEFLVQQSGFDRTAILRINGADVDETAGAMQQAFQTMFDTARDYACLAQKQTGEVEHNDILTPFVAVTTQRNPANMVPLNDAVRKTEADILALHEKNTEQVGAVMDELRETHQREIASRDEIIALQRADMEHLRGDLENTAALHAQQFAALQADLGARETAIATHQAEIERLHGRIADTDKAHAQQIATLQADLAERDSALAERLGEVDRLHRDIEKAAALHEQQLAVLQADLAARETAIASHQAEIERLHGRITDTDKTHAQQIATLQAELAERDSALAERLGEIDRLHRQIASIEADHGRERTARQADAASHDAAVASHLAEIKRLRRTLDTTRSRQAELRAELAGRKAIIAAQLAEIERLHDHVADVAFGERVAALQADLTVRDVAIAEHEAEAERLRQRIADAEAAYGQELAALRMELAARQAELSARDEAIAARDGIVAAREAAIAAHLSEIAGRDDRLAELSQIHEGACRRLQDSEREVTALRTSTSWRITAPLRAVSRAFTWLLRGPRWLARGVWAWITFKPDSRPRRALRAVFVGIAHFVLVRPRLAAFAKRMARRLPPDAYSRLRLATYRPPAASEPSAPPALPPSPIALVSPDKSDTPKQVIASTIDMSALQRVRTKLGTSA